MDKLVRWQQRFQNFKRAQQLLFEGIALKNPSIFEQQGIIQCYEFTFELAWKTLKDYLESKGVVAKYPRDVVKEAFHHEILEDGELLMEMLEQRNLMLHTYDEEKAELALRKIRNSFSPAFIQLVTFFSSKE